MGLDRLTIVKVGGKVVEEPELLNSLLNDFVCITGYKILVHGGGKAATALADRLGLETRMVDGRRITDSGMLEVVTMVYGGLVNKRVVAGLQSRNINAIGLTGADLDLIKAKKRAVGEIDYGYVGDVENVNSRELRLLLNENVVPVIAPLTHDGSGQILNTNADTIAAHLAIDLANYFKVFLFYCFEKRGVLSDPLDDDSVISELTELEFLKHQESGVISTGMIPKLQNGFKALYSGVNQVLITNPQNFSKGRGTRLLKV
jgi:acetylglutamate kinase